VFLFFPILLELLSIRQDDGVIDLHQDFPSPVDVRFHHHPPQRIDARSIRYALLALGFVVSRHLHIAPFFRLFHVIYYTQITRLSGLFRV
jgi:hypothetical protein